MKDEYRITPLGIGLIVLLVAALVGLLVGSRGVQEVSFVVIVLEVCLGVMALLASPGGYFTSFSRAKWSAFMPGSARAERFARMFEADPNELAGDHSESERPHDGERDAGPEATRAPEVPEPLKHPSL